MPVLELSEITGIITWIGHTPNRAETLRSRALTSADLTFEGLVGEDHGALTRASCGRVRGLYPMGTDIRNTRQLSVMSEEELGHIAANMGVGAIDPADLGATIVVRDIPDLTYLPPSSRLQAPSGATMTVDLENRPCHLPIETLEDSHPGKGKAFKSAAKGLRGVVAWVERPGTIAVGDSLKLFLPAQRAWTGVV